MQTNKNFIVIFERGNPNDSSNSHGNHVCTCHFNFMIYFYPSYLFVEIKYNINNNTRHFMFVVFFFMERVCSLQFGVCIEKVNSIEERKRKNSHETFHCNSAFVYCQDCWCSLQCIFCIQSREKRYCVSMKRKNQWILYHITLIISWFETRKMTLLCGNKPS